MTLAARQHEDETRSPMSAYAKAMLVSVVGIAIGLSATWFSTSGVYPFGAAESGPLTAWPKTGALDVDPYARAIIARHAEIPLGAGEGLAFVARVDDSGRPLEGSCDYTVVGQPPVARLWTLGVYTPSGQFITGTPGRRAITSAEALRSVNAPVTIVVAPNARTGNWLAAPKGRPIALALNLYDTGVSPTAAAIESLSLLSIRRGDCL